MEEQWKSASILRGSTTLQGAFGPRKGPFEIKKWSQMDCLSKYFNGLGWYDPNFTNLQLQAFCRPSHCGRWGPRKEIQAFLLARAAPSSSNFRCNLFPVFGSILLNERFLPTGERVIALSASRFSVMATARTES